jgi:hypothetical protein
VRWLAPGYARHPLELHLAAIREADAGSGDQIGDDARHQHFSGACLCHRPRGSMNRDAADVWSRLIWQETEARSPLHSM